MEWASLVLLSEQSTAFSMASAWKPAHTRHDGPAPGDEGL